MYMYICIYVYIYISKWGIYIHIFAFYHPSMAWPHLVLLVPHIRPILAKDFPGNLGTFLTTTGQRQGGGHKSQTFNKNARKKMPFFWI